MLSSRICRLVLVSRAKLILSLATYSTPSDPTRVSVERLEIPELAWTLLSLHPNLIMELSPVKAGNVSSLISGISKSTRPPYLLRFARLATSGVFSSPPIDNIRKSLKRCRLVSEIIGLHAFPMSIV